MNKYEFDHTIANVLLIIRPKCVRSIHLRSNGNNPNF